MKYIGIVVAVLFLSGCTAVTPLAELERQAMLTGDWSAVEKRERIQARRVANDGPRCPGGTVAYCRVDIGNKRCACVDRDVLSGAFARW